MKKSEILKTILEQYKNKTNGSSFICTNITNYTETNYIKTGDKDIITKGIEIQHQITADIQVELPHYCTYSSWLSRVHKIDITEEILREARIGYLIALIEYYQSNGD